MSTPATTSAITPLTQLPAWKALEEHAATLKSAHLRQLFAEDPQRATRFSLEAEGLFLDYSKNRITSVTVALLLELAEQSGLREHIDGMFRGNKINPTENRRVLHVALRMPKTQRLVVDGVDVVAEVHAVLDKMSDFAIAGAERRVEGFHGEARSQHREYRNRRLRSGSGDGL